MAVRGAIITMEEACSRYSMSREEFLAWEIAFGHFGERRLRAGGTREMQKMKSVSGAVDKSSDGNRPSCTDHAENQY